MELATEGVPWGTPHRCYDELVADMPSLGRIAAWRYAVGVAASAGSMHAALTDGGPQPEPAPRRPLACRTGHHAWITTHNPDGELYRACGRCGKMYVPIGRPGLIGG